jgi:hypothetical protein
MLRMNMTRAEKDLVAVQKKALEIYPGWVCCCCGLVYNRGTGNPLVDVLRRPRLMRFSTKECAATYIICEVCQKLKDAEITKGVIAGFLQRKLLIPTGA